MNCGVFRLNPAVPQEASTGKLPCLYKLLQQKKLLFVLMDIWLVDGRKKQWTGLFFLSLYCASSSLNALVTCTCTQHTCMC